MGKSERKQSIRGELGGRGNYVGVVSDAQESMTRNCGERDSQGVNKKTGSFGSRKDGGGTVHRKGFYGD